MIEVRNVTKIFRSKDQELHAVDRVSLEIEDGQIYGIVGYSGAGKSTLVRCINLLECPDEGSITVSGFGSIACGADGARFIPQGAGPERSEKLTEKHLKNLRRDIGMIFQHFNLLDRSTVFDNIAYPLRHGGLNREQIRSRVLELLELVDLQEKANAYPSELSGGQKQRVAIARALARKPKILLSDEATSALDPDATESILRLLKELNTKLNLTIVLITHEMAVVKAICDRVAVMENGRVVEKGEVYQVFAHPEQPVTKKFVDSSSGLGRIERLIETDSSILHDGTLIRCTYDKDCVGEALISEVSRRFGVNMNILLASLELLQGNPLGGLILLVDGDMDKRRAAIQYLCENNVIVEVIEHG
ncbi:MAG: ATP-binding cassette domain-containing protein [Oscillospiraceae bacterium]|nr:ATP-binding cassette domain-containing protein [Oscillospiraceae bacterium]